jgi:CheY-like chemotaxis protein
MSHRHVVLLVDDHPDSLHAMQELIEAHGFDVVATTDAEDALARLRAGLSCCLIIVDWRMPGMGGEQFHAALSCDPRLSDIRLLVLTGDPRAAVRARELGVRHVAYKPIEPSVLLAIVGEHCQSSAASRAS